MRPEKARSIVNRAIKDWLTGNVDTMYNDKTLRAVYKLQSKHLIWLHEHGYPESDYSPDIETDYTGIENEMQYISDRFDHPGRLAWLATGIEEELF